MGIPEPVLEALSYLIIAAVGWWLPGPNRRKRGTLVVSRRRKTDPPYGE